MSLYKCILCFKDIIKDYERFLVKSRKKTTFDVNFALANLDFLVSSCTRSPSTFVGSALEFSEKDKT